MIDLAKDAQTQLAEYQKASCDFIRSYDPAPTVAEEIISRAANMLDASERPLILAGHGVTISGAEKELAELAEKCDIPVGCTMHGLSALPTFHPLNKGMLGMHGNLGPNINTNRADVILAVGMRFDDRVTGDPAKYAPDAKIIHVDIDRSEFDKTVSSSLHVHGDARDVLTRILAAVKPARHTDWVQSFDRHEKVELERVKNRR